MTTSNRIQGCFLGIAIGDALGMPVETMSHEEILKDTAGKGLTGFIDPINRTDWLGDLKAGDTTDDWQLTAVVLRSLVRTKGAFDIVDCAEEHVRSYSKSKFGWGKTTEIAIEAIRDGKRIPGQDPLPPGVPGKGCGSGIVMKVSPLGVNNSLRRGSGEELWKDVKALGSMTHPDIRASIAAYAVALFLQRILESEGGMDASSGAAYLEIIIQTIKELETEEPSEYESVSERLEKITDHLDNAESLSRAVGSGFSALDAAAFAIGTFLRHPKDFKTGILEAVNAGGDTDTNASIAGALIGANCGLESIPVEWKSFSKAFEEPLELAEKLIDIY
ncbi:MAG: ADP-ribosylation/Crystallin [Parcubacteria group bacterium]|nr:ADP-ribosylation/Crystallin [Parcubacteria group bacterium]